MFQSDFFNLTKRRRHKKEQILIRFQDIIAHIKKKEAFNKIKRVSHTHKKKSKYKIFSEVENTFFHLRIKMPLAIHRWLMED